MRTASEMLLTILHNYYADIITRGFKFINSMCDLFIRLIITYSATYDHSPTYSFTSKLKKKIHTIK